MTEPTISKLFDLTGRVALVTGGAGYLGSAMCRALAEAGASVVVSSRDPERAQSAAKELPVVGDARHVGVALDHKDEQSLQHGFADAVTQAGQVDILVNNGQGGVAKDWTNVSAEEFESQLQNATGYFLLSRVFRDHIVERDAAGSIVMIGSMYGMVASYPEAYEDVCPASPVGYHALKGGIIQMTRHLSVYWATDQIRVNCLSPGPFPKETAPAEMVERLKTKSPLRRMGQPHELKGAVLLLASDAGSYLTGQNLVIDGGWTAW
ncbi:MAG: SDR family oxidoreductase [Planctomycetaceae bacterium]|nr:SDR family oxidoreductase [Planctomycetaceae bacterium]